MSLLMMLAACGGSTLKTQTFTQNTTWLVPAGVTMLVSASGKGAAGTPSTQETYQYREIVTTRYKTAGGSDVITTDYDGWDKPNGGDYCEPTQPDTGIYYQYLQCIYYKTGVRGNPATTGASSTAFGKTFPGGTGGPATLTAFSNISLNQPSYPIVVPAGGSITITYYG